MTEYFTKTKVARLRNGLRGVCVCRNSLGDPKAIHPYSPKIAILKNKVEEKARQTTTQDLKEALSRASQKRRLLIEEPKLDKS